MNKLVAGVLVTILSITTWLYSGTFPDLPEGYPGPSLFPRVVAVGLFASGLWLTIRAVHSYDREKTRVKQSRQQVVGFARLAAVILLIVLYPVLRDLMGFIPVVSIIGFAIGLLLKANLLWAAVASVGGTVLIYSVFTHLLGVPL